MRAALPGWGSGGRIGRSLREERGTRVELPSTRQSPARPADVARLDLQPRAHEPKLPIVRGPLDRLAKVSIGGTDVPVQLLDEGELESRARRPRLERARVTRILCGGRKVLVGRG